ncbi:MAG: hypothetical protein ACI4L9_07080 [Candidatus Coproplasma sp.]
MFSRKVISIIKLVFVSVVAAMVAVAAVVCFAPNGYFAWFAKNQNVSANGMNVSVESQTKVIDGVSYYIYDRYEDESKNYVFASNESTEFESYDILNNNIYQSAIKVSINSGVESVTVTAKTTAEYYLGDGDTKDHVLGADVNGNSLSSIIAFEVYSSDGKEISASDTSLTLTLPENVNKYAFVDENNNNVWTKEITLDNFTFDDPENSDGNAIYLIIKYNSTAIEEISTKHMGTEYVENLEEGKIPFINCDFNLYIA